LGAFFLSHGLKIGKDWQRRKSNPLPIAHLY
jgi:hypothetical protein